MAEDLPQTLQEMDRFKTNPLLFFLSPVMVRGEPQQEKVLTARSGEGPQQKRRPDSKY